ncbi:YbcC family protein [Gemmatimonas groenlandica]|uniref:Probable inorganic carbon transporter subunit DabA n=1 Tax=Gemmatimonas groenlandica TaxID=2732249 RepID=A0A6M4ISS7_9BACT|nr:DUF2309 domain-containing protein [Gemmatimonas groenlandica]QJR37148.1 DUF2309 domain-containing protein [Gemmatimonas groenlandica]
MSDTVSDSVMRAVETASARIAPAWPLDRLIAVNPWWGYVDRPIDEAAAELAALSGARLTMPRSWFRARYASSALTDAHLVRALEELGSSLSLNDVRSALQFDAPTLPVGLLVTDLVDATRETQRHAAWRDFVVEHVSHACGAWFGDGQAAWSADRDGGLYGLWSDMGQRDAGVRLLMGLPGFRRAVAALPQEPQQLIACAVDELAVPSALQAAYFTALLQSVSGWAAACAFQRWDARLAGGDDDQIVHLLATRLAWELVLYRTSGAPGLAQRWTDARREWVGLADAVRVAQSVDWVLQRALELAYQEPLAGQLAGPRHAASTTPSVQAVFCIDVRSEVMRRALEAAQPTAQTLGFAGFFGMPIAYQAAEGVLRPQLPGLLSPALAVADSGARVSAVQRERSDGAALAGAWTSFAGSAASTFTAVEATGLGAAVSLLRMTFAPTAPALDPLRDALATSDSPLSPRLGASIADGHVPTLAERTQLAANALRGMSLTRDFARLVALVGHGAATCNNPQAAGLACGACGGQSGEVNARVAAALLNDADVRDALLAHDIRIPGTTHFVPALHDTVTDTVSLFDLADVPATHRDDVIAFERALAEAGRLARRERAPRLGLAHADDDALLGALRRRAADWSEVRPEWGLARNAAFVVAPRERTRGLVLDGRSFLHEYRWQDDIGFAVLTLILTAPMVVTNWINLQYYASTVDPVRYGSGDKVLHNVVGGNVGVVEGAGGDLRIGLALQSVHDGADWVHEPLRLSVFVEAPAAAIDGIISAHAVVRQLVTNGWLYLYRIDPFDGQIYARRAHDWQLVRARS